MSRTPQKQAVVVRFNPKVQALSRCMRLHAQYGPAAFQKFLSTAEFDRLWAAVPRDQRRRAIIAMKEAEAVAFFNDGLPAPAKPKRRPTSRWLTPAARAQLAQAYRVANGDHEKAGRLLGCTAGAARLAKKRHLDAAEAQVSAAA